MDFRISLLCSAATLAVLPAPASAQDVHPLRQSTSAAPVASSGVAGSATAVGELIVTAQKRTESIDKVPIAITAVTGSKLLQEGVVSVANLTSIAPDVQIHTAAADGFVGITIRGISNADYSAGGNPAVSTYIDGVYVDLPEEFTDELYDISRIEILRGPQGTLYGRNSTGGSLNIITADPDDTFGGFADVSYGSYNDVLAHAAVDIPVSDGLTLRASGFLHRSDGYSATDGTTSRGYGASDDFGGRLTGLFKPSPMFTWRLSLDAFRAGGTPGALIATAPDGQALDGRPVYGSRPVSPDPEPYKHFGSTAIRSRMELSPADGLTLSYIAGYQHLKYDIAWASMGEGGDVPLGGYRLNSHLVSDSTSQEIDASYKRGPFENVAGAAYFWSHTAVHASGFVFPIDGLYGATLPYDGVRKQSWGIFDQATWSVLPKLRVTGGVRYSHDAESGAPASSIYCLFGADPSVTVLQAQSVSATAPGCLGLFTVPGGSTSSQKVTWRAGVDYDLAPGVLAYVTVATGYKQGGVQPTAPAPFSKTFEPETNINYEVGLKGSYFDGVLSLRVAGFYTDYTNLQVFQFLNTTMQTGVLVTTNAGAARIYGVELEPVWAPTPADRVEGFVTYNNARYVRFDDAEDPFSGALISSLKGNQLPNAPDFTIRGQYSHKFTLANGGTLSPQAAVYYQTRSYTNAINSENYRIPAYTKTDLSVTYASPGARTTISIFVLNVENSIVRNSNIVGQGIVYSDFMPPRTWGVRAAHTF